MDGTCSLLTPGLPAKTVAMKMNLRHVYLPQHQLETVQWLCDTNVVLNESTDTSNLMSMKQLGDMRIKLF
jgi:hypothetical protein